MKGIKRPEQIDMIGLAWEQITPSVFNGKLGDWVVARVSWFLTRSDDGPYNVRLLLPGLKNLSLGSK